MTDSLVEYIIYLDCTIEGSIYEFSKIWRSPIKLEKGDIVYINGLEEVKVREVIWYLTDKPTACVSLEDVNCDGAAHDWKCILEDMDGCSPGLESRTTHNETKNVGRNGNVIDDG